VASPVFGGVADAYLQDGEIYREEWGRGAGIYRDEDGLGAGRRGGKFLPRAGRRGDADAE